ncbi:retropepsin-like aspartic protease family protein [Bowmanella dokdonensis]|uniref:TIGR02281 family clan AA aspartic protease n=1 Tax=Bowmanella dokdonensis TaxID=751969 RepID=A0A939IQ07_9ALTE|nr:TIGR02281 family clan AA aspartic protease [Bowmanella dokdonensis]MBN7824117.1 TIGR02281 family clan AA aspartic protease [Bowmanella dokdonensis]
MWVLAWISGLGLLTLMFDRQLAEQFNPNPDPHSVRQDQSVEVKLKRNRQGHYVTSGFINDEPVIFLLDTGATHVSVPMHLARQLGLEPGAVQTVSTANGLVQVARTEIKQLEIGDIQLHDIRANLNPGMQSDEILLGMSALQQVDFRQSGEWLYLTSDR